MSRSRRSALTYGTSILFTATTLVVGFIAVPLLLQWLGEERYGAFRSIVDWFAYLTLLELGLGGALLPLIARALGREDEDGVRNAVAAGVRAYSYVTALMVLGGVALAVSITVLIPVAVEVRPDLRRAAFLLLISLLFVPLHPFRALADARQEGYRINALLLVQSLVITGLGLLLAWRGWGITGQIAATVVGATVFFGALAGHALRRQPRALGRMFRPADIALEWRGLWKLNTPTFIRQLAGRFSLMSDRIIVAALLGPAMVVPLYVTQRLAELMRGQIQSLGSSTWAALAELHAQRRHDVFNERVVELTRLVAVLGVAALVPIVAYNRHFVGMWVGIDRYGGDMVTAVAAANALLLATVTLWDWCLGGTGKVAMLVPVSLVSTLVNLTLSLALTPWLGIAGPLIGTLVATVSSTAWYVPILLERAFGTSSRALARAVGVPLLWAGPYLALAWWAAHSHDPAGWIGLGAEMAVGPGVFLAAWWKLGLTAQQRVAYAAQVRTLRGSTTSS